MHHSSRVRSFSVLLAVMVVVALCAPSVALAAVGGPYSKSPSNPEDNGIIGPTGGSLDLHGFGMVEFPAGALAANTAISAQVWNVRGGPVNGDGSVMRTLVEFKPDGTTFAVPVYLSLTIPSDIRAETAAIYAWNTTTSSWDKQTSLKNGDKVISSIEHFSWYGVGGVPIAVTSTPASSTWSMSLALVAALGVALVLRRRSVITEG